MFEYMFVENVKSIEIMNKSEALLLNDSNLMELFTKCQNFTSVQISDYLLTNKLIECMIQHSPHSTRREIEFCGWNYDQKIASE